MEFTSKDILYLTLALCALVFTIFSSWAIYYVAMILKDSHHLLRQIRELVDRVERIFNGVSEHFGTAATYLKMIAAAASKFTDFGSTQSTSKKKRRASEDADDESDG